MKSIRIYTLLSCYTLFLLFFCAFSHAAYQDLDAADEYSTFDGIYTFNGTDLFGTIFEYDILFDLYQDPVTNEYQYRYQVHFNSDGYDPGDPDDGKASFQLFETTHFPGVANDIGWDIGPGLEPDGAWDDGLSAEWWWPSGGPNTLNETETSAWLWITSYGWPTLFESYGDTTYGAASGDLPAPIPEPHTVVLLSLGILGLGWFHFKKTATKRLFQ